MVARSTPPLPPGGRVSGVAGDPRRADLGHPADGLADEVVIRLDSKATKVEILDNGVVVKSARLNNVDAVQIIGNADTDRLTVNYSAGFYKFPISFAADGGTDAIISIGDTNYTLTDGTLTSSGGARSPSPASIVPS